MPSLQATVKVDGKEILGVLEDFDLHARCVFAVNKMVEDGVEKHISYISNEDDISFDLMEGGKIPRVTIEWVDASEADPEKHK